MRQVAMILSILALVLYYPFLTSKAEPISNQNSRSSVYIHDDFDDGLKPYWSWSGGRVGGNVVVDTTLFNVWTDDSTYLRIETREFLSAAGHKYDSLFGLRFVIPDISRPSTIFAAVSFPFSSPAPSIQGAAVLGVTSTGKRVLMAWASRDNDGITMPGFQDYVGHNLLIALRTYQDSTWVAYYDEDRWYEQPNHGLIFSGAFGNDGGSGEVFTAIELSGYRWYNIPPEPSRYISYGRFTYFQGPLVTNLSTMELSAPHGGATPSRLITYDVDYDWMDTYSGADPKWLGSYPLGISFSESESWLEISNNGNGTWTMSANTTDLPVGTYSANVTISLSNACFDDVDFPSEISSTVTYTVTDQPVIREIIDPGWGSQLLVKWDGASNPAITGYYIRVSKDPDHTPWLTQTWFPAQGAVPHQGLVTGLEPNTGYYVYIISSGQGGGGAVPTPDTANYATIPVLLVHGINSAPTIWSNFEYWLRMQHFNYVWTATLPFPTGVFPDNDFDANAFGLSQFVHQKLDELSLKTGLPGLGCNIIAHSMGGLVARRLLRNEPSLQVPQLIMLGTPNGGADFVPKVARFMPIEVNLQIYSPGALAMSPENMARFNKNNKHRTTTKYTNIVGIGGRADFNCSELVNLNCETKYRLGTLATKCPNDGVVSRESMIDPAQGTQQPSNDWAICHSSYYVNNDLFISSVLPRLKSVNSPPESPGNLQPSDLQSAPQVSHSSCDSTSMGGIAVDTIYAEGGDLTLRLFTSDRLANFLVSSPAGTTYDSTNIGTYGNADFSSDTDSRTYYFGSALPGSWIISVDASQCSSPIVYYCIEAYQENTLALSADIDTQYAVVGDTLVVFAELADASSPVLGSNVTAQPVSNLVDSLPMVNLLDNGQGADLLEGDGVYTGTFRAPSDSGLVSIWVEAVGTNILGNPFKRIAAPFILVNLAYTCGDADHSSAVSISDVVYLINFIFSGGPAPDPLLSGDADCSGTVNISDAVYLINYIFSGGAAPCEACN